MLIESNELKFELEKLKQHHDKGIVETSFNTGLDAAISMIRILELFTGKKEKLYGNKN